MITELSTEQLELLFGERLDSTIFTWQNYCGTLGISLIDMYNNRTTSKSIFNPRYTCRGWCHAGSLIVRSRAQGYAVMLWDTSEQLDVWCHVEDFMAESLWDLYKTLNNL